jgi:hypothetical protein
VSLNYHVIDSFEATITELVSLLAATGMTGLSRTHRVVYCLSLVCRLHRIEPHRPKRLILSP